MKNKCYDYIAAASTCAVELVTHALWRTALLVCSQGVLQAASSLVSDFTAALKVRKKGSAVRSLMRDLSHAAQAAESPSECQARKNHPPPLVATGGGECGKATSQGEGDGEAGELGRSWRLAESFLLVGQVYKRSSADGWGGVARWRKRLALLRVGTCACGGGARARRNDDVCLYLFRPLPKEHKGGSLLRFLSRKGSVPSTGSSSTTSGASSAASTPTHVDDVLQILSQVPRRVRGRDVLDVLEPVDIGEPVSRAALAVSCADPEAKGGCSMLKVTLVPLIPFLLKRACVLWCVCRNGPASRTRSYERQGREGRGPWGGSGGWRSV